MQEGLKRKVKLSQLQNLVDAGGFKFTENFNVPWFDYTSCLIGPYYVQSMEIFKTKKYRESAIRSMMFAIKEFVLVDPPILSFGESRDWPFGFCLAQAMNKDIKMLYKDGTSFGVPDQKLKWKNLLHIADLNNEGTSIKKWNEMIQKTEGKITNVLFYVDRMEDGVDVCNELNINRHAVIELDDECWEYLRKKNVVSQAMYDDLISYWKDRKAWGCKKILEHPEPLIQLIRNEKKHQRGVGILKIYNHLTNGELAKKLDIDPETLIQNQ